MKQRNLWTELNLPNEQEKSAATIAMNEAAKERNKTLSKAETLREEIAELEAELKLTYYSDERYGQIQFAINLKKSSLADAELTMKTEKAKYNAAKKAYREVIYSLSYKSKRQMISRYTYQINRCNREIESLEKKIEKLKQDILDEQARRKQLDADIKAEEEKYKELEKKAKQPGPMID